MIHQAIGIAISERGIVDTQNDVRSARMLSAAVSGFGMALLYPNLSAAVADISHPNWRGSAIGIYRFWRDLGYGIGGLGLGMVAHFSGQMEAAFWFVALSMFASGGLLWLLGEETHPRLNSAH